MTKKKLAKDNFAEQQDDDEFATPLSVILFKDDATSLVELAKKTGIRKSCLIRLFIHDSLANNRLSTILAS